MKRESFYITTAIHYANAAPHIGHAYENICADVMARFKRLDGYDVYFLTGMDEHGQKVQQKAKENKIDSQKYVDSISDTFRVMNRNLNLSNDDFIRTTENRHKRAAQLFWKKLEEKGDIYLGKYEGWYSIRDEAFYSENEVTISEDGKRIAIDSKTEVEWMVEESYFFRLSAYTDRLLKLYEVRPDMIQPASRRNEVINFVKQGLHDLSISRTSFTWGIPVLGNDRHVMYVWVDALINYLSALDYPERNAPLYNRFWPCDVHLVGKDIVRFHAIYWPAFLISAEIPLPRVIHGHGHILNNGEKMSKSLGNVISPQDLINKYGSDATRYVLMREITFGQDGNISDESAVIRINSELANTIGNLVQRTLCLIYKNCKGLIPNCNTLQKVDYDLLNTCDETLLGKLRKHSEIMQFNRAIGEIVQLAVAANAYIDEQAPWTLKKTDYYRMETVLYVLAEIIRQLGIALQPYTPVASGRILDQLGIAETQRNFSFLSRDYALKSGLPILEPEGVFPRINFA
ncbi:MAG: methionine--tRNA ligase [Rhizonema sp. NSF051]|nr:methionine--tRNA ligase [Rhizonema sp. NSF051]